MNKKRYWEPLEIPDNDLLKDWAEKNVIEAITQLIDEGSCYLAIKDGRLVITFTSLDKPEKEGIYQDVWHKEFDLLEMVLERANDYNDLPAISEDQRKDLEDHANLLDEIAAKFRSVAKLD